MWICPKCDTRNEYAYCMLCGEPKPTVDESEVMLRKNDRVIKVLLAVIAALVVIMILFLCVVPMMNNISSSHESEMDKNISYKATPTPTATSEHKVKDDKIKEDEQSDGLQIVGVSARKHSNKVDEIIIEMTEFVEPTMSTLPDPARVLLDFEGCTLANKTVSTGISGHNFKNIRKGEHETYSRVVIDISVSCSVSTEVRDNKCYVTLTPKN